MEIRWNHRVTLLGLLIILIYLFYYSSMDSIQTDSVIVKVQETLETTENTKYCPQKSGLITIWDDGRLGNNMCSYATLWAYAKKYNLKPMMTSLLAENLNIFPHLSIKSMDCEFRAKDWTIFSINEFRSTQLTMEELQQMNVKIDTYSCELAEFHGYRKEIISEFRMENEIEEKSQEFLRKIKHDIKVGIHVRRTDYVELYGSKYHKNIPSKLFYEKVKKYFNIKKYDFNFPIF